LNRSPHGRDRSRFAAALQDLGEGARQWPQWFTLGNLEIRLRFRRTGLGPVWTSLSFAILVAALAAVYARVLGLAVRDYAPYLALGLFVWTFLSTVLLEACDVFVHAAHTLKQLYLPRSAFLYRLLWRNLVLLSFNSIVVAVVLAMCRVPIRPGAALALPGLLLLCVNLLWVSLFLAMAGARFWAVGRAVQAALPIAMLVTPILWRPGAAALRPLADWNPLWFAIQLVRGPLLGTPTPPGVWIGATACAALGGGAALLAFAARRDRIPYWL
jgi:ABC-2 type transport system permease protein/lipopolysaccharide transport system permease protein